MSDFVLWRIVSVKVLQIAVVVGAIALIWYGTTELLDFILGGLIHPDGRVFTIEYSRTLALVLMACAAAVTLVAWQIRRFLPKLNGRMKIWALRRP